MKKITIKNAQEVTDCGDNDDGHYCKFEVTGPDEMDAFDGYHTFTELYDHRIALWIALCKIHSLVDTVFPKVKLEKGKLNETTGMIEGFANITYTPVWRSKLHDDGSEYKGWFILGIGKEKGKIMTYHLPNDRWDLTSFAETLDRAPEYDGHTSADVLERLKNLY